MAAARTTLVLPTCSRMFCRKRSTSNPSRYTEVKPSRISPRYARDRAESARELSMVLMSSFFLRLCRDIQPVQ